MSQFIRLRLPRMTLWIIITLLLLAALALIAPAQLKVVLYKAALVSFGAVLSYWIDRALFPDERPHKCGSDHLLMAAWVRRALITLACILGLTLGL